MIDAYEKKIFFISQDNDNILAQLKEAKALLVGDNLVNDAISEALNEKAQLRLDVEALTSWNDTLKKWVESLQSHYECYRQSVDDLGAKAERIKKDHEMQVLRIFNQSK